MSTGSALIDNLNFKILRILKCHQILNVKFVVMSYDMKLENIFG